MATTSVLRELWDTTRMRLLVEIGRQGSVSAAAAEIDQGRIVILNEAKNLAAPPRRVAPHETLRSAQGDSENHD